MNTPIVSEVYVIATYIKHIVATDPANYGAVLLKHRAVSFMSGKEHTFDARGKHLENDLKALIPNAKVEFVRDKKKCSQIKVTCKPENLASFELEGDTKQLDEIATTLRLICPTIDRHRKRRASHERLMEQFRQKSATPNAPN